jgi:chromate transporter
MRKNGINEMFELFLTFAKIGLFTFGGGYAMIAPIERICVEKKQWITHDEMMDITVIAESTPGPIAINCATYVGFKRKGTAGALAATAGMILPSFCIIFAVSVFLDRFLEIAWIAHAFLGIKIAVGILILDAAVRMLRKLRREPAQIVFMLCAFAATVLITVFSANISSVVLMLTAGLAGLLVFIAREAAGKGGTGK